MSKKINIDIWRFVVSFLIVAIHISPFAKINSEFDFFFTRILGRIAVPLFLMITGYYILDKSIKDKKVLINYTKKILKIYLFCILLYLTINIYMGSFKDVNMILIIKDLLINGTLYHLWYFPALIVGIWIVYYLIRKLGQRKTFIIAILLYIIGLLGDSYYGLISINEVTKNIYDAMFNVFDYTRNGLFYVPIFLCLGYIVKEKTKNIKFNLLYSLIFFVLMCVEGSILHYYNLQRHDSMYIFLIPLMYFLFDYLINHSKTSNKKIRNIATYVYIFHPLFIVGIRFVSRLIKMNEILVENNLVLYIMVCVVTTVFAFLIEKIKEVINNERKKLIKR